jgi:BASS family bile acid:Na+ symporter
MTILDIVSKILLPIGLIIVMFGMGLTLTLADFKRVFLNPKPALTGILGQLILLPLVGFIFINLFSLPPEIAIGVMIIAACPGGIVSNVICFSGKADVALSISLTAINSFITVITLPIIVKFSLIWVYGTGQTPDLPVLQTIGMLFSVTVLPVVIGMISGKRFPNFAIRSEPIFRRAGTWMLIFFIIFAVWGEIDFVMENLAQVAPFSLLFNLVMMLIGYLLASILSLGLLQKATVTVEIAVQNNTIAFLVALTILGNRQYMIFSGFYGIIMMITAFAFVTWYRKARIEPVLKANTR